MKIRYRFLTPTLYLHFDNQKDVSVVLKATYPIRFLAQPFSALFACNHRVEDDMSVYIVLHGEVKAHSTELHVHFDGEEEFTLTSIKPKA